MKLKKTLALFSAAMLAVGTMAGCGGSAASGSTASTGGEGASAASAATDAPVELIWYTRFDDQADTAKVNEELNKLTMEKIGCTVKMINIPGGTYNEKMQVILGGREECDVVFAGASFADYWGNAMRGAFLPLNDLLQEYGKETYDAVPADFWEGVKLGGEIYGVINYQIEAKEAGYFVPTETLEKYNFDLSTVKEIRDIEPLLEMIKQNEPGITPINVNEIDLLPLIGYDEIGSYGSPGAVMIGDDELKVVNQYETPEWRAFVDLMREWYQKGYIATDAATNTNGNDLIKAGKVGCYLGNMKPGGKEESEVLWGREMTVQKIMEGRVLSSSIAATLNCISSTSKHPEKAMEFINLLNTDKEVYNLVCFGLEGVHYNKVGDNRIELVQNSGYQPNKAWAMGNQFNAYVYGTQSDTVWEETIALNESASVSGLLGFVFDPEPVKSEVAQCQSVWDQYFLSIIKGSVDPDQYVPEFLEKLKAAGVDKIIAEKQAQIDAWKASK